MSAIVSMMKEHAYRAEETPEEQEHFVALVRAIETRDQRAFETLYDATIDRVFGLAMRVTNQHSIAEEVVSDVYLQVWNQASSYSATRGKVIAWLCVLSRSRALDALRRENTRTRHSEVALESVPETAAATETGGIDLLVLIEEDSRLHAALGQLNTQQRQLLALAYFRGFTHQELADFTDIPLGTVKTTIHRAVKKLKKLMSNNMGTSGDDVGCK